MKKILIANRGEIAVRIIRSCREMGIEPIAVFSDIDRTSPHVLMAPKAYSIGAAPSSKSYLNMDHIINVAKETKVDAIHPGYGFLSENAKFAKEVQKAGFIWIGPPVEAMLDLGDKVKARQIAKNANVPVIPGSDEAITSEKEAKDIAQSIGFPVLVKAVGGGGGKGMRIVHKPSELPSALERAMSEASSAFSDERTYIEKYISNPRHIEIQIVADTHGNIAAFTERECSIQRRYQKIIEETPSTFISRNLWKTITECARKIIRESGYLGAGTVEFLVDKNKKFYFLEMNTRLQVEHPVTEMVAGIDLVREQILVASGEELTLKHKTVDHQGHAIECRIYAENGFNNFIPSIGTIHELYLPDGFGVRFDHGIRAGQEITPHYDPLLGKLIVWGNNREETIERMKRALRECHIVGIETTIPFCLAVISHRRFRSGDYNTNFIPEELDHLLGYKKKNSKVKREIASVAAAIHSLNTKSNSMTNGMKKKPKSQWKSIGRKEGLN